MQTNTEVVQAVLEAFGRGDIPALLGMCTENVDVVFFGNAAIIPWAGQWKGKNGVAEYFRAIGQALDVLKWAPQHNTASGNRVAAFGIMDVRVKATGETIVDSHWALDFTVENGKVIGWQSYLDTAGIEKAFTATSKASM
jgi:ketosteroid isomerase-like protein